MRSERLESERKVRAQMGEWKGGEERIGRGDGEKREGGGGGEMGSRKRRG